MGVIAALRRALERSAGRLDALERRVRSQVGGSESAAAAGALSAGPALWRELSSQEDLAYVRVSGVRLAPGIWPARRQWFTPAGACEDDPEFAEIAIYAVGGAVPFQNGAGFVRFSGLRGENNEPVWLTLSGEWHGFQARLIGPVDASYSYRWSMVAQPPFRVALTSESPGLTRAYDYASQSYESVVGGMWRTSYPTGTTVVLRADIQVPNRMIFHGYSEPQTIANCEA